MKRSEPALPEQYADTVIRRVNWTHDLDVVRRLFQRYREWLADHAGPAFRRDSRVPPGLARFDRTISELPGAYGPPKGDVLLAFRRSDVVACGALREVDPGVAEIKRIYVRPDHFGPVFGPRLVRSLLRRARALGYERVRLDALPTMEAAIQYYQDMGFRRIPRYWAHPVAGALFFECSAP
jgi:ribosomal protein S18 acetylase RimI-like enzyme